MYTHRTDAFRVLQYQSSGSLNSAGIDRVVWLRATVVFGRLVISMVYILRSHRCHGMMVLVTDHQLQAWNT